MLARGHGDMGRHNEDIRPRRHVDPSVNTRYRFKLREMEADPIVRMTGAVIPGSVDAEFGEVLTDVVDDLL